MRTRRSNKSKSFEYKPAFELSSEENVSEIEEVEKADEDVEFDEPEGDDEGQGEGPSDAEEEDHTLNAKVREEEDLLQEAKRVGADDGGDSDASDGSEGAFVYKRRLPNRSVTHEVPRYPTILQQTRVYQGPLSRVTRGKHLINLLYGSQPEHLNIVRQLLQKWFKSRTLPHKSAGDGVMHSPWLAEDYEARQDHWSRAWYAKYRAAKGDLQALRKIRSDHAEMFRPSTGDLVCLTGPFDAQKQIRTKYGLGLPVSEAGEPQEATDPSSQSPTTPKAWLLDTGAIPLAIAWAPVVGHKEQLLAVCTVPYSDQDYKDADWPEEDPGAKKNGSVQIWSVPCHKDDGSHARLIHLFSFDWGRPKRLQWCPVPPPDDAQVGLLAILCGDGQARVIEVPKATSDQENLKWVTSPVATLGITDEYAVKATCLTWVNTNRICLGHSDGSVSLWSIHPQHMVMRHAVHFSQVLDISSGFPSHPYHIATVPVSGCPTLTDLALPSAETTYIPVPGCVNFQPNLLDWNDHLQGYLSIQPSASPHNTVVGWAHVRYFVHSRAMMTTSSPPTCIASGRTHPFALVGCADGSLWAFNPLRGLAREYGDDLYKLKILQHEFRPPTKFTSAAAGGENVRGAVRILQGFLPEFNMNPRPEIEAQIEKEKLQNLKKGRPANSGNGNGRSKGKGRTNENEDGLKPLEELALLKTLEQARVVIYEPRTRITVVAWNPNVEYGWWAAAAMGSGLVKVMDLGIGK